MPRQISPIPGNTQIVNPPNGGITTFFRLRWEEVRSALGFTPDVANIGPPNPIVTGLTAALSTTTAVAVTSGGAYRISYYLRKTVADGVSSSLTMTLGWTDHGLPLTAVEGPLTLDSSAAWQSGTVTVNADTSSPITYAVAYTSHTPGTMQYNALVVVEQLA